MIELRTLGGVDLRGPEGRELRSIVAGPKRLALLAYLALQSPSGYQRRDTLLGLFWPELDQDHARNALRNALSILRHGLGSGVLVSRGDEEVGLDPERFWCDAVAFGRGLAAGELEQALGLYRGDLLEGFFVSGAPEFEHWLEGRRSALRERAARAAWQLAERQEAAGNVAGAGHWARRAGAFAPYDEDVQRRLIELLDRLGDRAGAIAAYEDFVRRLAAQLDLAPTAETRALIEAVRAREPRFSAPEPRLPVESEPRRFGEEESASGMRPAAVQQAAVAELASPPVEPTPGHRAEGGQLELPRHRAAEALPLHPLPGRRRLGTRPLLTAATALLLLIVAAGLYYFFRDRVSDSAPALGPAPGLAVLPFTVQGPDLELWREGMVTVLSTNLDGTAGLRAIDPRAVLSHWDTDIGEGKDAPDRQAALRVARTLGSKYALMGSMVGSKDAVRLTAELYDVSSGAPLGTEQVEGKPDSLLALIDRLSIRMLVTGLVGGSAQMPRLRTRLTTSSLPALKAFLEGEQAYRGSHLGDAAAAFTRAVETDSTFAFAYYRLATLGCDWESVTCDPNADYLSLAKRYSDLLPERDRLLFEAWTPGYRYSGQAQAALKRFTTLYPDDVEGWFLLGDISYHPINATWSYVPQKDAMAAFRRALELDPGFGPAYSHLIPDAIARDDTLEARQLLAGLRQIDSTSEQAIGQTLAYELAFGDSGRARAAAALDTASTAVLREALSAGQFASCCATSPGHWEQDLQVARALTAPRHPLDQRQWAQLIIGMLYQSRGRIREAREAYAAIPGEAPGFLRFVRLQQQVGFLRFVSLQQQPGGRGDLAMAREAARKLATDPANPGTWNRILLGFFAAEEGRREDLEREIQALESVAGAEESVADSLFRAAGAEALRGVEASLRGDREAAIRSLEAALPHLWGPLPALLRYELGRLWLEQDGFVEAERYLESLEMREPRAWSAPVEFYLGKVYEGLGNFEEARLHYGRFVSWWQDCDPELRPIWDQGRAALQRLEGMKPL